MHTFSKRIAAILAASVFFLLQVTMPVTADETADTQALLNHHLEAFGTANMEAILSDYADDAVLVIPGVQFRGAAEIKPVFEGLFAEFGQEGVTFMMIDSYVQDNVAYIVWSAETPDNSYEIGTDTFVIEDGKIAIQTLAFKAVSKK